MNTVVIFVLVLVVLLVVLAIWWTVSALRQRNRTAEAEPPAPDPLAALTSSLSEGQERMQNHVSNSLKNLQDRLDKLAEQGGQTQQQLRDVADSNSDLKDTTTKLQNLLSDNQDRGSWGERLAEDVIQAAGLLKGVHYLAQDETEKGKRPDFSFMLPEKKRLHMDIKFPLANYQRYAEAKTKEEQKKYLKGFMSDVGDHIKGLANRGYAEEDDGVGFVLLFIPVESVWGTILQQKKSLLPDQKTRVALCSPTTLLPILMMIRNIMDSLQMVANSQEIVNAVVAFEEEWEKYEEWVKGVKKALGTLTNKFETLTSTRTNVLRRSMNKVTTLRNDSASPQKLPRPADQQDPPVDIDAA